MNPYTRLQENCRAWACKVRFRRKITMFRFKNVRTSTNGFQMWDVRERISAAESLGYDVILTVEDKDVIASYIEKIPDPPYEIS